MGSSLVYQARAQILAFQSRLHHFLAVALGELLKLSVPPGLLARDVDDRRRLRAPLQLLGMLKAQRLW